MKYLKKFKLFEDISKRSSKEDVLKALSEIKTLGTVNPIDGRDMYIDGINIELRYWDGYLWIGSIYVISEERGQGKATRLIQKICDIADKYGIHYEKPCKKNDLLFKINEYISKKCFKEIETTNASQIDLITIGKNIKNKFNNVFPMEEKIDYVLIENQISPIANRMKTIQGMIAQYFIMNNNTQHIEFISSINKLKSQDSKQDNKQEDKTQNSNDYKSRKKQGIQKCLEILTSDFRFNNQIEYFNIHKKKDDLSDSFLQGMWFINKQNL